MSFFYLDTSALVKVFQTEVGTEVMTNLVSNREENSFWVLELVRVEFLCSLFRKFRNRELNETQLQNATEGFQEQLTYFHVEPISRAITEEAENLIQTLGKEKGLRTLDAFHFAAFQIIARLFLAHFKNSLL